MPAQKNTVEEVDVDELEAQVLQTNQPTMANGNGHTVMTDLYRHVSDMDASALTDYGLHLDDSEPDSVASDTDRRRASSVRRKSRFEEYVHEQTVGVLGDDQDWDTVPEPPESAPSHKLPPIDESVVSERRQSRFEDYFKERSARWQGDMSPDPEQPVANPTPPPVESPAVVSERRQSRFEEYYKERSASFVAPLPPAESFGRVHFQDVDASTLTSYGSDKKTPDEAGAIERRQSRFEDYYKKEVVAAQDKRLSTISTSTSVATPEPPKRQPLVDDQTYYSEHSGSGASTREEEYDNFAPDDLPDFFSPETRRSRRFTDAVINATGDQHYDRRVSGLTYFTGLDGSGRDGPSTVSSYAVGQTGKDGEYRTKSNTTLCVVLIVFALIVAGVVPIVVCGILGQCSSSSNDVETVDATNATVSPTINPNPPTVVINTVPPRPVRNSTNTNANLDNAGIDFVEIELGTSGATMEIPNYSLQKLEDPLSPQANAYLWFVYTYAAEQLVAMPMWRRQQLFALATFYFAFRGARWDPADQQQWLDPNVHECQWSVDIVCYFEPESAALQMPPPVGGGIGARDVDLSGRVRAIRMLDFIAPIELSSTMGATGVPPEVELLQWMQVLELQRLGGLEDTSLDALLPLSELSNMPFLMTLGLTENQMTGTLPTELGILTQLQFLKLYQNQFTGVLPSELGLLTDLNQIWLDNNDLTGTVPAPLCDLTLIRNGLDVDIDCQEVTCPATGCNCDCVQTHGGRWM